MILVAAFTQSYWNFRLERREVFSAYQGVVKESTRLQQQLKSMLNEHCVRLPKGFRLWSPSTACRRPSVTSQRFAQSNKLVAYFGLNPSVCQSGN